MRSAIAEAVAGRRRERLARLTPDERVQLAVRLGEEGIAEYMRVHGVDRRTAAARIKAARRLGRPLSRSAQADGD